MYSVIRYDETVLDLLPQPQEEFKIIGRLVTVYDGREWLLSEEPLDTPYIKTYDNDRYDRNDYISNGNKAAFIALDGGGRRVGNIRVCEWWNRNAFIEDLLVAKDCRGRGIGKMLMDAAVKWGRESGYYGVSLETQDNNLRACRFYLKYGFKLGGIDNRTYDAFSVKGETALYFYLK